MMKVNSNKESVLGKYKCVKMKKRSGQDQEKNPKEHAIKANRAGMFESQIWLCAF